jgi:23S rRNA (uracil1939-C5)-methyltransferase
MAERTDPAGMEVIELELVGMAPRGDATGVGPDGEPVYVAYGIPGERVRARVYKRGRLYAGADLVEVVRPSPHRVTPPCPLYGTCNGCQLQHVAPAEQLRIKRAMVIAELARSGGFVDPPVAPVIGMDEPWHYRNHARFTVRRGRLGFVRRHRRQFFEVERCLLMEPRINELLARLQGRLHETTQCNIRVGAGDADVILQPRLEHVDVASGQAALFERMGGHSFRVSAAAFYQVNRAQAERMGELVCAEVGSGDKVVVDAYAGVGTFAVLLAARVARVVAIEESGPAVRDAKVNIEGLENIKLRLGKTELVLAEMADAGEHVDAIVLDPPRSGCHADALAAVIRLAPSTVVYVSCDPASLARDLRILADGGFTLARVQPLDMFPQTVHVECIATLVR